MVVDLTVEDNQLRLVIGRGGFEELSLIGTQAFLPKNHWLASTASCFDYGESRMDQEGHIRFPDAVGIRTTMS